MALPEVEVHFQFAGGIETKADFKAVPRTKLLTLENGVFDRAISIKKRNGYVDIGQTVDGSTSPVAGAIRMATRGDEMLEFTPSRCYSRQTGSAQWSDVGAVYSAVGTDRALVTTGTQQTMPDHATLSGVTVVAWEDSAGGVWWSTIDATTGRVYLAPTQADAAGISPRCVTCGNNLHVYYAVPAQRRIMVIVVSPSAPARVVTPAILTDDIDATGTVYDACPTQRADLAAVIGWFESGTTNIRLGYVDQSGVLGSPLLGYPSVRTITASRLATSPLAVFYSSATPGVTSASNDVIGFLLIQNPTFGNIASLSAGDASHPIGQVFSNSATPYAAVSVQRIAVGVTSAGIAGIAWEEAAAAPSNRFVVTAAVNVRTMAVTAGGTMRSVGLASRGFVIGSDVFATFVHDVTFFNTYVTFRITRVATDGFVPVGRHLPAEAAGAPTRKHLSSAPVVGSVVEIALPMRTRLVSENNDKFTQTALRLVSMDFDNELSHQAASFGAGLYMAGACPMHYDGRIWTELGFHVGPEVIATASAAGGSMTPSTTYEYKAWYEWTDAQGEIHLGPTSAGTLVTMGASDTQVTLTLPTCRVTRKPGVRIMVARSKAALTGDTAQFFRVTSLDTTTAGTANGFVPNSTTTDTVTFIDRLSDTTLATFDQIYTVGGILANDPAALGAAIARGKDRLFASDASDGTLVRYSQPIVDGYGVQWPPDLFLRVPPEHGNVTALAARDNRVIVWSERGISTFAGDGPAPDGTTNTSGFSAVQVIPSDVGCTEPASIVRTPNGDMFKSAKGIYLLGNDFATSYIGAPVEAFNAQTIRRATVLPDRTQVVFLTDSGSTLLYDYLFNQWSTFTNHEGLDAAVVSNQYHYLRADGGGVYRETIGAFSDAGIRIRLRFETAWIHMLDQLQGFQSFSCIHLIGTWVSAHQLGVQYQTDYTPYWTDPVWFDATAQASSVGWITGSGANTIGVESIAGTNYNDGLYDVGQYGGTSLGEYAWRLDLYETGQSIQFRFEDFEAVGFSGASFELTELVIVGQVLGNVRRPMTAGRSA